MRRMQNLTNETLELSIGITETGNHSMLFPTGTVSNNQITPQDGKDLSFVSKQLLHPTHRLEKRTELTELGIENGTYFYQKISTSE